MARSTQARLPVDQAVKDNCLIHVLYFGQPLCNFTQDAPVKWPQGHLWVGLHERGDCNCEVCAKVAVEAAKP